jgi:hypothetical protein
VRRKPRELLRAKAVRVPKAAREEGWKREHERGLEVRQGDFENTECRSHSSMSTIYATVEQEVLWTKRSVSRTRGGARATMKGGAREFEVVVEGAIL